MRRRDDDGCDRETARGPGLGRSVRRPTARAARRRPAGRAGTDPLLRRAVEIARRDLVIEVGPWKGRSAVVMAAASRALGLDAAVLRIGTRLGSVVRLLDDRIRPVLGIRRGWPTLFEQRLAAVPRRRAGPRPRGPDHASAADLDHRCQLLVAPGDSGEPRLSGCLARGGRRAGRPRGPLALLRPGGLPVGDDRIAAFAGGARTCAAFARRDGPVPEVHAVKFVLREPAEARDGETAPTAVPAAA